MYKMKCRHPIKLTLNNTVKRGEYFDVDNQEDFETFLRCNVAEDVTNGEKSDINSDLISELQSDLQVKKEEAEKLAKENEELRKKLADLEIIVSDDITDEITASLKKGKK